MHEQNPPRDYPDMDDKEYWEARQNLYGLFSLLLKIDRRVNPHLYKKNSDKNDCGNGEK